MSTPTRVPPPRFHRSRLGHLPALDGLRAVAVVAVVAFHGGALPGGFIGVDVFFAISGYLITGLALSEIESEGRLDLLAFWIRRARRLLPALFALVAVLVTAALVIDAVSDEQVAPPGRDVLASLAYVANWTRAFGGDAYFDAYEDPSSLQHTWSLAVEEQFYLFWPLALVGLAAMARRRGVPLRTVLGTTAAGFAAVSTAWATLLAADGPPFDRLYFGTDTRAVGLALGCAVACASARGDRTGSRPTPPLLTAATIPATVVLVVLASTLDGSERWLYGPGFAAIAIASVVLVDASSRSGPISRVLALRPLPALGRVSYGIYLWHWPTMVILDRERTGLNGPSIWIVWIAVTGVATYASWRLVEQRVPAPVGRPTLFAYCVVPVVLVIGATVVEGATRPTLASEFAVPTAVDATTGPLAVPTSVATRSESSPTTDSATTDSATTDSGPTDVVVPSLPTDRPARILVLGDSVAESLGQSPPSTVDGRPVDVVNRGIVACPVNPTGAWRYDNGSVVTDPAECEGDDRFDAIVDDVDPDIVIAMFGWPGTIAARTLDDGRTVVACDPEHDRLWATGFTDLATRYSGRAVVVAATVAPPQRFVDPDQSDRPGCLNEALRSTSVRLVEWGEWMCPGGDCERAAGLRRDPVHFAEDPEVRTIVWDALLRHVMEAAVR